jgi:uncharacterized protein YegP (UPF0339 family)
LAKLLPVGPGRGKVCQPTFRNRGRAVAYKFEIFKDKAGEFRVRFRASNGEVMFSSEGYASKSSAKNMIESIKKNAPDADVVDESAA